MASRTRFELGGIEAVVAETRDRLSHQYRKRFLFVKAGNDLLTIYTMVLYCQVSQPSRVWATMPPGTDTPTPPTIQPFCASRKKMSRYSAEAT